MATLRFLVPNTTHAYSHMQQACLNRGVPHSLYVSDEFFDGAVETLRAYPIAQGEPNEANTVNVSTDLYRNELDGLLIMSLEYNDSKLNASDAKKYTYDLLGINTGAFVNITEDFRYSNVNLAKNGLPKD